MSVSSNGLTVTAGNAGQSTARESPASVARGHGALLVALAVGAGVVCRAGQYAAARSFWVDEAALLLNVRSHTFGRLFGGLDYDQAAPPLFMAAERGLLLALGPSELSLRLIPLACGIAALFVFSLLARKVLDSPWDALAVALFAFSDRFIWHGTEVKQYGIDLFVAVLLMWIAIGPGEKWSASRRVVVIAGIAAVAAWFSYAAMLVFAAISLALMPRGRGKGSGVAPYLIANAVAAASFLILVGTVIRAQQTAGLVTYWNGEFLDMHRPWIWPWWIVRRLHSMCNYAIPGAGPVLLIAMVAGAVRMWRARRFERLAVIAGPLLVVLAASAAHRYPFDGARLTTFLCGPLLILAAAGLEIGFAGASSAVSRGGAPALKVIAIVPAAYVLVVASVSAAAHLVVPRNRGHLRPVLAHVREVVRPGDRVYVLNDRRAFFWYWPAAEGRLNLGRVSSEGLAADRFWIVWSFSNDTGKHLADPALKWARSFAAERDAFYSNGGAAVLMTPERASSALPPSIDSVFDVPANP
jgi:hypothetical protein